MIAQIIGAFISICWRWYNCLLINIFNLFLNLFSNNSEYATMFENVGCLLHWFLFNVYQLYFRYLYLYICKFYFNRPQKKNPDALELLRGKTGRSMLHLNYIYIYIFGYNSYRQCNRLFVYFERFVDINYPMHIQSYPKDFPVLIIKICRKTKNRCSIPFRQFRTAYPSL